ncbi:hypothetical protein G6O67_003386 [Ophiocordyceps sinensis]|uniref:Uncharacterized protein n=1 Tax=Ophiocordyceps sinensis TaxID=72228 RepID=A0A8H4PWD1_9HYPO|nr:hypothetical protein G6O67_003386 [Ophiocordyceps sinensis]
MEQPRRQVATQWTQLTAQDKDRFCFAVEARDQRAGESMAGLLGMGRPRGAGGLGAAASSDINELARGLGFDKHLAGHDAERVLRLSAARADDAWVAVALVGLGVQIAQELRRREGIMLTMMLCRADLHNTTRKKGKYVPDPLGFHATMALKTADEAAGHTMIHVSSLGCLSVVLVCAPAIMETAIERAHKERAWAVVRS